MCVYHTVTETTIKVPFQEVGTVRDIVGCLDEAFL